MTKPHIISVERTPALDRGIQMNGGGLSHSIRVSEISGRYAEILSRTPMPELSDNEKMLLRDACNGGMHFEQPEMLSLSTNVEDAIAVEGLDKKWEIDGASLVARLRELTFVEELKVVEEVIEAFFSERRARATENV